MRLLIVEDNVRFGRLLAEHLSGAAFSVDLTLEAREFLVIAEQRRHDMYLVDLGLPDGDGTSLIRTARGSGDNTPALILTAHADVHSRVAGLDAGADDYLVKPFNVLELQARIRALMRRPRRLAPQRLRAGNLFLDLTSGEVHHGSGRLDLSPSELRLLSLLIRRSGSVVARETIEGAVQGINSLSSPNAVDKLVSRLRKALAAKATGQRLKTVKGIGYVLEEA